jgi:hypothetical protein
MTDAVNAGGLRCAQFEMEILPSGEINQFPCHRIAASY